MTQKPGERPSIVVGGLGVICALGTNSDQFFDYLSGGKIDPSLAEKLVHAEDEPVVDLLGVREPRLKISRYMDPVSKNAIVALQQLLSDAELDANQISKDPFRYGLVFGTTRGPQTTRDKLYDAFAKRQRQLVSGTLFSHCGYNMAAGVAAMGYAIKGPNLTLCGKRELGMDLLRRASQLLVSRRVHTVFVGFSEANLTARRDGGTLREMAYILCLENRQHAIQRRSGGLIELEELVCDRCPLEVGQMYGARRPADRALDISEAERLPLKLDENLIGFEKYGPLIKLGFLARALTTSTSYSSYFLPLRTRDNVVVLKIRHDDTGHCG